MLATSAPVAIGKLRLLILCKKKPSLGTDADVCVYSSQVMSASFISAMNVRAEDAVAEEFDQVSDEDEDDDDGPGIHVSGPAFGNLVLDCYDPESAAGALLTVERDPTLTVVVDPGAEELLKQAKELMAYEKDERMLTDEELAEALKEYSEDDEECNDGCSYNFYICSYCFAFGTDDPDCDKCGKEMCVLLYQEANAALALVKAKQ